MQSNITRTLGAWLALGVFAVSCGGVSKTEADRGGAAGMGIAGSGNAAGTAGTPPSAGGAPQCSAGGSANVGGFTSSNVCGLCRLCSVEGMQCAHHIRGPGSDETQFVCCRESLTCKGGAYDNPAYDECQPQSCPSTLPVEGTSCGQCNMGCRYGAGCAADGTGQNVEAYCNDGLWQITDVGCIACCQSDADCPGAMCAGNRCEPLNHAPGCFRDTECGSGSICAGAQICACGDAYQCRHVDRPGVCVPSGQGCCAQSGDCPNGGTCIGGVCKASPPAGQCWTDADCPVDCLDVSVCPCGSSCIAADHPGTCVGPM